jgi:hypothetical protein
VWSHVSIHLVHSGLQLALLVSINNGRTQLLGHTTTETSELIFRQGQGQQPCSKEAMLLLLLLLLLQ